MLHSIAPVDSNILDALHICSGKVPALLVVVHPLFLVAPGQLFSYQLQKRQRALLSVEAVKPVKLHSPEHGQHNAFSKRS